MKERIILTVSLALAFATAAAAQDPNIDELGETYINSLGMKFILIRPGAFRMGSEDGEWDERPVHDVMISRHFYMLETEVTTDHYRLFDPNYAGSWYADGVSWHQATAFGQWLSTQEGLPYRLPTEAEWEYSCRAGTTTPYSSGEDPPEGTVPNPWGIKRMHDWPAEWVMDWYGEYSYHDRFDPVGPEWGVARVVRGGGLDSDDVKYMTSANRSSMGPGFGAGNGPIGFRLVLGGAPTSSAGPYEAPFVQQGVKTHDTYVLQGPDPNAPYFNQRPLLPIPPDNSWDDGIQAAGLHPAFMGHNHSPGMEVLSNGDVLAIYYTSESEYGEDVALMGTRLRFGSEQWDMPCLMFDFVGANDHAPLLWNDGGVLHLFWGNPGLGGVYPFQWISSQGNGATWGEVKFPVFEGPAGPHSKQPINTALRVGQTMYVSSDGEDSESVLWVSSNNGLTWYDPGGRTGGRHTTFALLNDGRILGMGGKNTDFNGYMPKSISSDGGQSWHVSGTPFSPLGSNQRPSILRLASGRLFFCSDFQQNWDCYQPPDVTENGALVALSEDEGENWLIKKIPTALPHEWSWCGPTLGYSVARQGANGVIHIITSMNHPCQHFEMNEAWILDPNVGGPVGPYDSGTVNHYQETHPSGALKASWSAKTGDDGRYLLHGTESWYYEDGQKQYEATYHEGRKVGAEYYRGRGGMQQWNWSHDEANDTSVWTQFWPNGLRRVESAWRYGGKVAHGIAYHWNRCGAPEAAWEFFDGWLWSEAPLPEPQVEDPTRARIYHVDADAVGANNGLSWADAFNHLQDALAAAAGCDEIRVAQGTYKPDQGAAATPGNRTRTFRLKNGTPIKGGYAGFGESDPNARDIARYETILSGDLNGDDGANFANYADNSYHVVTALGADTAAVLDGFTVTGGNADGWHPHSVGGGLLCQDGSPTITRCRFSANRARESGGGMYNYASSAAILSCCFSGNSTAEHGGGMCNWDFSMVIMANCTFLGNTAAGRGGGMYNHLDNRVWVANCTFGGNAAGGIGGGLANSDSVVRVMNTILWGNTDAGQSVQDAQICGTGAHYSCVQDADANDLSVCPGIGNIDDDPLFVEPGGYDCDGAWCGGDYRVLPGSPCIDAADNARVLADDYDLDGDGNTAEPIPWDIGGDPRIADGDNNGSAVVDMGAYEFFLWPIEVTMRFTPQAFNPGSEGNWFKLHFVLPDGYDINDVDLNTPAKCTLTDTGEMIESDYLNAFVNEEGLVEVEAAFDRSAFALCLSQPAERTLTVMGSIKATSGQGFCGTDTVKIINNTLQQIALLASYWLAEGCDSPDWCDGLDLDQDGTVNLADFALFEGCCIEIVTE